MIVLTIQKEEAGRKLARFLEKILPKAPRGLLFKAFRNQKIKINGKKPADLSVVLQVGDEVRLFFTDEQLLSFGYEEKTKKQPASSDFPAVPVIYEDEQLLILDKPVGMLSQKSRPEDVSLTEIGCRMIAEKGGVLRGYRPGVCNRLDRNTAGAVILAKTLEAGQAVARMLREHRLGKYYWALVEGTPEKWRRETVLVHGWAKDEVHNKAELVPWQEGLVGYQRIESRVRLLTEYDRYSLVEVQLLTGKSHQIRSQLAWEGYPILQDGKYNHRAREYRPLLVAKRLEFHDCPEPLAYMEGRAVEAATPPAMQRYINRHEKRK